MAGSDDRENPVAVNVVPLVDIIFCLCVFFMCSFKFKQLEGKFDAWLPKDTRPDGGQMVRMPEEIRVALLWDATTQHVTRKFGFRTIDDDEEFVGAIRDAYASHLAAGRPDVPATIDADGAVPWQEVAHVLDLAKSEPALRIQFAAGAAPLSRPRR